MEISPFINIQLVDERESMAESHSPMDRSNSSLETINSKLLGSSSSPVNSPRLRSTSRSTNSMATTRSALIVINEFTNLSTENLVKDKAQLEIFDDLMSKWFFTNSQFNGAVIGVSTSNLSSDYLLFAYSLICLRHGFVPPTSFQCREISPNRFVFEIRWSLQSSHQLFVQIFSDLFVLEMSAAPINTKIEYSEGDIYGSKMKTNNYFYDQQSDGIECLQIKLTKYFPLGTKLFEKVKQHFSS